LFFIGEGGGSPFKLVVLHVMFQKWVWQLGRNLAAKCAAQAIFPIYSIEIAIWASSWLITASHSLLILWYNTSSCSSLLYFQWIGFTLKVSNVSRHLAGKLGIPSDIVYLILIKGFRSQVHYVCLFPSVFLLWGTQGASIDEVAFSLGLAVVQEDDSRAQILARGKYVSGRQDSLQIMTLKSFYCTLFQ
jgi:hypothetical protein